MDSKMVESQGKDKESASASIAAVHASHKALEEKIKIKMQERSELKEITQNQLKNISELQKKCEESFITINHLPQTRQAAAEKFNEAMRETATLQNKQFKVNELLNLSMSEFDETIILVNAAKQQVELQKELANQRLLIYDADPKELSRLSKKNISLFLESLNSKNSILEEFKMFLKQSRIEEMKSELRNIKKRTEDLDASNSNLQRELLMIESNLKTCIENSDAFGKKMENEFASLEEELENWKRKSEELKNGLSAVENQILNIMNITEEEKANYASLKVKFDQEVANIEVIQNDLINRSNDLGIHKEELNHCLARNEKLKEKIITLNGTKALCSTTEIHIKELSDKKNKMIVQQALLNTELSTRRKENSAAENKLSNMNLSIANLKSTLSTASAKNKNALEAFEKEKETSENTIKILCSDIDSSRHVNSLLKEEIENKKNLLNNRSNYLVKIREEYEKKKSDLIERREKINNKKKILSEDQIKTKFNELSKEIDNKKQEISKAKEREKTIAALLEKIQVERRKYTELVDSFEKEKEDLKELCQNKLEGKLSEIQNLKNEKQKVLEEVRDGTSKAEFLYHRLKRQLQLLKGEVNSAKDTINMHQCENDMLKMLIGWLHSDSQASAVVSDPQITEEESEDNASLPTRESKGKVDSKNKESNSPIDEIEEMPAPEMSIQEYRRARTLEKTMEEKKENNPSPKRTRKNHKKKSKKEPKDSFIFDWVMDSSSQLSSN